MVVEVRHLVEIQTLSAGDCFIYCNTVYMLLEDNENYIEKNYEFPYTAVALETGRINQISSWAEVVKANASVIVE